MKTHHFHTKLPHQKPMIRQIEWWLQNGPIKKNGDLPVTTLFFWKFCFSLRPSYKDLTWCTNEPNARIRTFCRGWSFIWWCFFPVSIFDLSSENCIATNCFTWLYFLNFFVAMSFAISLKEDWSSGFYLLITRIILFVFKTFYSNGFQNF